MSEYGFRGFNLGSIPATRNECSDAIRYLMRALTGINSQIAQINDDKNKGMIIDNRRLRDLYRSRESAIKTKLLIDSRISEINEEIKKENISRQDKEDKVLIQIMRKLITEEQFIEACARARGEA